MISALLLALILLILSIIHFNWALGGTFGLEVTSPTNPEGEKVLNPKKIDSAIVGIVSTTLTLYYIFVSGIFPIALSQWMYYYLGWIIPSIFILNAIGEFKYIRFF